MPNSKKILLRSLQMEQFSDIEKNGIYIDCYVLNFYKIVQLAKMFLVKFLSCDI